MSELLLILNSEEIPAGMQRDAAERLGTALEAELGALRGKDSTSSRLFWGARHIAACLDVADIIPASVKSERGPRESAPEQALAGFLRKHGASKDDLTLENGFWLLNKAEPEVSATTRIAEALPELLWKFTWPKSMRWGSGSHFTWVRPLRRIVCLLNGALVPFSLEREGDNAHGLASGAQTEGHRFLNPEPFTVSSCAQWIEESRRRHVLVDPAERLNVIDKALEGTGAPATASLPSAENVPEGSAIAPDADLAIEVSGLTQWPSLYFGKIDAEFMTLPPEVMQVSMRINQRYFALRTPDGKAAPYFGFFANMGFVDKGALTKAGNERVLRARFADARHFWDLDRKTPLADRVDALTLVTFHAKLGTQKERVDRMVERAGDVARAMGLSEAQTAEARRAALLAKADLTTGMVGEFPELQGVMGGYYARHDGEPDSVANAVAEHYMPRGLSDAVPTDPVSVAVALADRIDMLAGFFTIGETPTGSGDPYGLRRAALGVIRTIRDNTLRLDLGALLGAASPEAASAVLAFITERLRVQLRSEGARHDVLSAILANGLDSDLVRLLARTAALAAMLETEDGRNLLAASKRAANILRIENKKDGPHTGQPEPAFFDQPEEEALAAAIADARRSMGAALAEERFEEAMRAASGMRPALDCFFEEVTVNAADPAKRANRLRLLSTLGDALSEIADFSRIEG